MVTTLPTARGGVSGTYEGLKHELPHANCKFRTDPNYPLPEGEGRIAFVSPHCVMDFSNGAATATRDGLASWPAKDFNARRFAARGSTGRVRSSMQKRSRGFGPRTAQDARIGPFADG